MSCYLLIGALMGSSILIACHPGFNGQCSGDSYSGRALVFGYEMPHNVEKPETQVSLSILYIYHLS
jgi:hypothetical protein